MQFRENTRYRMPVSFGPAPGPRQRVGGARVIDPMARVQGVATRFLTDAERLEALLPPGMSLDGEPVVSVELLFITELAWLAGRGYNSLGVKLPVVCQGQTETLRGPFLSVLWENMADPMVTGREELGYAKLYCEIDQPAILKDRLRYRAGWQGHRLFEMELTDILPADKPPEREGDGLLHYRYVPAIGRPGVADFAGPTLSPPSPCFEWLDHKTANGRLRFIHSTWEELPTLVHIVNTLAKLPILEYRGSTISEWRQDVEFANQRLVR